jgi:hypothetical protein
MKAKDFRNVILFMANVWDKNTAIKIFGEVMGEHFWNKWCGSHERYGDADYATMRLFYEMSDLYMQKLLNYIYINYKG